MLVGRVGFLNRAWLRVAPLVTRAFLHESH
jgi:hypothetical protein